MAALTRKSTRLFGDGKHGRAEPIQTFRCQACRTTFTSRRNTPLYRLKTPSHQVAMVLAALAEGLDPSAASRVFGYQQATITTWLTRVGKHAQTLHERFFCHLHLPHLQLDELRTRLRSQTRVLWVQRFTMVDNSDISPTRLTALETRFILASQGALPAPHFKQRGSLWPFLCTCTCS